MELLLNAALGRPGIRKLQLVSYRAKGNHRIVQKVPAPNDGAGNMAHPQELRANSR
jgi:hypothetical protein